MSELTWHTVPPLRRPLLLMAYEGLFDAGGSATAALEWIRDHTDTTLIAEIDAEPYFNFQEHRPQIVLEDGKRSIVWPSTKVWACRTDGIRDLVVMIGVEPHLMWRSFADHIVEIARRSGAEITATIGAMVAMAVHTRPFPITGSAADAELARRLSIGQPTYEGPTGVVGVINERLDQVGLPVISLRVSVPHYVPAPPNPKATQALLRRIQQTANVPTKYEELDHDASEWVRRVDAAVSSDLESQNYVERLERQVDSSEDSLPSGDELASELEAFLRDRSSDSGSDSGSDAGGGPAVDDPGGSGPNDRSTEGPVDGDVSDEDG